MECIHGSVCDSFEGSHAKDCEFFKPEQEWISVKDRLPEPGERVIATNGAIVLEMHRRLFNQEMCWARYGIKLEDFYEPVTHWMPLPQPPNCGAKMDVPKSQALGNLEDGKEGR